MSLRSQSKHKAGSVFRDAVFFPPLRSEISRMGFWGADEGGGVTPGRSCVTRTRHTAGASSFAHCLILKLSHPPIGVPCQIDTLLKYSVFFSGVGWESGTEPRSRIFLWVTAKERGKVENMDESVGLDKCVNFTTLFWLNIKE